MPFRVGSEILETFEEKRSFAPETIRSIHDDLPQITASEQNDIPECKLLLENSSAYDNTSGINYTERELYRPDSGPVDRWPYISSVVCNRRYLVTEMW